MISALGGCGERATFRPGTDCELNTECGSNLVCRLGRCRRECRANRDCTVGLTCVRDEGGFGACQLPEETSCVLSSECPEPLVCRNGSCTNACEDDRDCPSGSRCIEDESGGFGCQDMAMTECRLNSDCDAPLVCAVDGLCREECRSNRDCRDGTICDPDFDPRAPVCRLPMSEDAGPPDAGPTDTGPADSGPIDTGPVDAPMDAPQIDAGVDAMMSMDVGPDASVMTSMLGAFRLTCGTRHCCASPSGTNLYCWGANTREQIGDGTSEDRDQPVLTSVTGPIQHVAAGSNHTCAQTTGGLYCWGDNQEAQLGLGTQTMSEQPTLVSGVNAIDLAAGDEHTCALEPSGPRCWGANEAGQIGDATNMRRTTPTAVSGLRALPIVQLDGDGRHNCVLYNDGTAQCWGSSSQGQLGDGSAASTSSTPVDVVGLTGAVEIAAGSNHTCARLGTGALRCWGDNFFRQLGDGTRTQRNTPVAVSTIDNATQITCDLTHTCARRSDGTVWCWGDNVHGQLAMPFGGFSATPVDIGLTSIEEVAGGEQHNCVREVGGGTHRCWGRNGAGQLGAGGMMASYMPVVVVFP